MMMMAIGMTSNLMFGGLSPALLLPRTTVATIVPSLGRLAPSLAVQVVPDKPNIIGSPRAMCISLFHHGVAVQHGVTISTVIPVSWSASLISAVAVERLTSSLAMRLLSV